MQDARPNNSGPCHLDAPPSRVPEVCTPEDLARDVPTDEIFQEHAAGIPQDLNRAMYALCQFVGEDQSRRFSLFGRLHPALLLHWRVHADLVSRWGPDLWRDYRELWAQEMVGGHPALTFGTPPILGSISLEEQTGKEPRPRQRASARRSLRTGRTTSEPRLRPRKSRLVPCSPGLQVGRRE